jgi:hypothetical protein
MSSQRKKVGRPTSITKQTVRKLEQAFKSGLDISGACYVSGVSRSAYYERLAKDIEFQDSMLLAQRWVTMRARMVIADAI